MCTAASISVRMHSCERIACRGVSSPLPTPSPPRPDLPSQAPKPSAGPHKTRECLPLILLLRNRLKYALTGKEVTSILMQRLVEVDGKVRTDRTYPVGFMDVVDIPKTGEGRGGGDRPRDARVRAPCVRACV